MLAEFDKEERSSAQSDALFAQNLKDGIRVCEEKLDMLLDAHLEKTITSEEYTAKKNKILVQKIELEKKLKDFKRQGNRWLECTRELIKSAHQAKIIALQENFSELKNFLQKVGSNPLLRERQVLISFKNDWQILANQSAERRSREARSLSCPNWLGEMDSNHHSRLQRPESYH